MNWHGKELVTIGDLGNAATTLTSRKQAQEFMRLYRAESPHADDNIGYISGYYDHETMTRIQDWCEVAHPIFGRATITPEQAFAAGKAFASGADPDDLKAMLDPTSR